MRHEKTVDAPEFYGNSGGFWPQAHRHTANREQEGKPCIQMLYTFSSSMMVDGSSDKQERSSIDSVPRHGSLADAGVPVEMNVMRSTTLYTYAEAEKTRWLADVRSANKLKHIFVLQMDLGSQCARIPCKLPERKVDWLWAWRTIVGCWLDLSQNKRWSRQVPQQIASAPELLQHFVCLLMSLVIVDSA